MAATSAVGAVSALIMTVMVSPSSAEVAAVETLSSNAGDGIESSPIDGVHWSPQAHSAIGQAIAASVKGLTK